MVQQDAPTHVGGGLAWRRREVLAWRLASTPAGDELARCRVAFEIDGGRIRIRENKKSAKKRKKSQRMKFSTPWREPKVLVIFAVDRDGEMKKHRQPLIDETLLGLDDLSKRAAWHLYRLGAAKAEAVVFLSEGAFWIWDRLDGIIGRAGLDRSRMVRDLDWCHAVQQISRALTLLKQSRRSAGRIGEARGRLLEQTQGVDRDPASSEAGRSRPSANLRLQSNAMYWAEENVEAIFALRAELLSNRWESMLRAVQHSISRDTRPTWRWSAMLMNTDAPVTLLPPSPELSRRTEVGGVTV